MKAYILLLYLLSHFTISVYGQCPPVNITAVPDCQNGTIQLIADTGLVSYSWSPAANLSNPNIYNPVATAPGTYTLTTTQIGPNLIANPDFFSGNTGFTSGLNFTTVYSPCNYYVGSIWFSNLYPNLTDHTPTADNMFMHIDGCSQPTVAWQQSNITIQPNTNYDFSFWASRADVAQPTFQITFIGNVTGSSVLNTVNGIPYTGTWMWDQYGVQNWNSGANTSLTIVITDMQTAGYGNDYGLDDFDIHILCTGIDTVVASFTTTSSNLLGPDTTICPGGLLQLQSIPASSYLWSTGSTAQSITISAPGTYFVQALVNNCLIYDTINITTVLPPATLSDTIACGNTSILITAPPADSWLWSTGSTAQNITVSSAGIYTLISTISGCNFNDTIAVTFIAPPTPIADTTICNNSAVMLNGPPADFWLWSTGSNTQNISVSSPGTYQLISIISSCIFNDTIVVSPVTFQTLPDTSLCANTSLQLTGPAADSWLWSTGNTTQTITVSAPGTYQLTTTISGCSFTDAIVVSAISQPPALADTIVCGAPSYLAAAPLADSWSWSTGSTAQTTTITNSGTYQLTTTISGCVFADTFAVSITVQPNMGNDFSLCETASVQLNAGSVGSSYLWSTGEVTPAIFPQAGGLYWVEVMNGNCVLRDTLLIEGAPEGIDLFIPNAFTPNNDSKNERFTAYGENITSFTMQIYNRWGTLIFETNDQAAGWDGRYAGALVQNDVYVYVISYQTPCGKNAVRRKVGHVSVFSLRE
ncbi:MAG: gliding motility-associated C-terminal domain-containing protein [Bacteroidia bacterium]